MASSSLSSVAIVSALALCLGSAPAGAQTEQSRRALTDYASLLMVKRDVGAAMARYFDAKLIQHDAEIGDGGHGDEDFLSNRRKEKPQQFLSEEQYHTVADNLLADGDRARVWRFATTAASS